MKNNKTEMWQVQIIIKLLEESIQEPNKVFHSKNLVYLSIPYLRESNGSIIIKMNNKTIF